MLESIGRLRLLPMIPGSVPVRRPRRLVPSSTSTSHHPDVQLPRIPVFSREPQLKTLVADEGPSTNRHHNHWMIRCSLLVTILSRWNSSTVVRQQ
ncbi:hypothetical protein AVEN_212590-1 [Araneus ventricosus]|uniref:Uncharacterized protein n=1 Tax=Araneus ventricosus TaxID=182803 RepID=A0A4Y2LNE6_ARAVE|nr:hypothetical protein AVEN_212590-1 [Araneus ventricosus]